MSALDRLFWRDEILQALFWPRGEGLSIAPDLGQIARVLAVERDIIVSALDSLVSDGHLRVLRNGTSTLTDLGMAKGEGRIQVEIGPLTRPAHGESAQGCWCLDPDHAGERCRSEQRPIPAPSGAR